MHEASKGLYGARKVWWQLEREGIKVACCTVERLMAKHGLKGAIRGRRWRTTIPDGQAQRAPDLVDRNFTASAPNHLWVADFTYVSTWSGVCYVAFVIDAFSRRIVGWKADATMQTSLVLDTLEMALWARDHAGLPVGEGIIHHSDAGSQLGLNRSSQQPRLSVIDAHFYQVVWLPSSWEAETTPKGPYSEGLVTLVRSSRSRSAVAY